MTRSVQTTIVIAVMAGLVGGPALRAPAARADEGHAKHMGAGKTEDGRQGSAALDVELLDLELVDQDGRTVRFRQDVVGDRLVVIDTFYTTCGLICPLLAALFMNLQKQLGDRLGQDVALVSISVDPGTDTPARLKDYARAHGAKPGWIFLTGGKRSIDRVLRGVGGYSRDYTQHPSMILVGDGRHGGWTRYYNFPPPGRILDRLEELRVSRLARAE